MTAGGGGEGGPIPALALIGAGALAGFAMLAVVIGRGGDVGRTELPPAEPVSHVEFHAEDQADGSILVRDAADRHLLLTVRPGEDNFFRATLRGLAQARQREGLGRETPFTLTRFDNGTLSLADTATNRTIPLEAFGRPNALAFARLLPAETGRDDTTGTVR